MSAGGAATLSINLEPPTQRQAPNISKSDEDFLEDGVEFVWGSDTINIGELNDLFEKVCHRSVVAYHHV
jgi:hypothetical protein